MQARRTDARLLTVLLLLAVLSYLNSLGNAFVYDDGKQVVENPYIRSWHYMPEIFGSNVWSFLGAAGVTNYYRPLMTLAYLVCYQIFGLVPFGYHLLNLVLHAGVVWLVLRISTQLFGSRPVAFVAAALFALHPIHTESVTWIAGLTDLELVFFYLLTFSLFLDAGKASPSRWRLQVGMGGSFLLALLSKEPAVTLPVLATIYEHLYREDRTATMFRQKIGRYGILWVLALAYLVFRVWLLGALAPVLRRVLVSWPEAILSGFALVAQYMWKLLWPVELCVHYVFRKSTNLADPRVLAGVAVFLVAGWLSFLLWPRQRRITFSFVWLLLTLAPVLNARWMAANVFAERYLYLPSLGFCWLVAWLWTWARERLTTRPARQALVVLLGILLVLYGIRVVIRNRDWRNEDTLYTQTLRVFPDAYLIRTNLGTVYWNRGDYAAAIREWQRALPYNPDDVTLLNNMGLAYAQQKRFAEAEQSFRHAMRVRPDYAEPYLNLGRMYEQMGRSEDARREYEAAIQRAPLHTGAHTRLGWLLLDAGEPDAALTECQRSLAIEPTAPAAVGLGRVLLQDKDLPGAERAFRNAIQLDPYEVRAHVGLAEVCQAQGRDAEALQAYDRALRLSPLDKQLRARRQELAERNK